MVLVDLSWGWLVFAETGRLGLGTACLLSDFLKVFLKKEIS
jgi:hypothetical protein